MDARTLTEAMPGLELGRARQMLPHLERAMREGHITTERRAAAWLAQLGHESVSLRYMEEIASGAAYEGRRDLGNTQAGDGRRYKGRGPIQLTGRSNYRSASAALHLPLEAKPTLAATPAVGFRVAVWYWTSRGLNAYADRGDFDGITYRINGGYNGKADRDARYAACRKLGSRLLPSKPSPVTGWERYRLRLLTAKGVSRVRRTRAARALAARRGWLLNMGRRKGWSSKRARGSKWSARQGLIGRALARFRR